MRETTQYLVPIRKTYYSRNNYDIYPSFPTQNANILEGYESLIDEVSNEQCLILDGYIGANWSEIVKYFTTLLEGKGKNIQLINIETYLKPEKDIHKLLTPFLGGNDPIFGKITDLDLTDYFDKLKLAEILLNTDNDINIIYGTGSGLSNVKGLLIYFDVPKNELQYRMRAGSVNNLGLKSPEEPKKMYKHFYFVDWVILNKEKKRLLPKIDIIVDQQRPDHPLWMKGDGLRKTLEKMGQSYFRVRPWFEPGVWGGNWMKDRFDQLNKDVPNYAWSFEMIVPENGILLENNGFLLEVSFDMLMYHQRDNILGKAAKTFKDEFPIRFDFLDTYNGGNLSVQCHPSVAYIKKEFGEQFTQDETYYILDAEKDANVYLGFNENINPNEFRQQLELSYKTKETLDIEKYVQKLPAKKHDLFLIPNSTIHCSGTNNLVLEISATPYIYTFKLYDWQRLDLEGNPRPLNIDRAFKNLNFDRKGAVVQETLISKPIIIANGEDWKKIHLTTHKEHFYEIYRYEFESEIQISTLNHCHILMLVEGTSLELKVDHNINQKFNYAETFAIPAATNHYTLINKSKAIAKVVVAHVKDSAC